MSAFLVNDLHIKAMLQYAARVFRAKYSSNFYYYHQGLRHDIATDEEIQRAGQILVNENYRSLNARYGGPDKPHTFTNPFMRAIKTPIEIVKACKCYNYQACETDDYEQREAYSIVNDIMHLAIEAVPGYEEAQWEITR